MYLEYADIVWDNCMQTYAELLEKIQKLQELLLGSYLISLDYICIVNRAGNLYILEEQNINYI